MFLCFSSFIPFLTTHDSLNRRRGLHRDKTGGDRAKIGRDRAKTGRDREKTGDDADREIDSFLGADTGASSFALLRSCHDVVRLGLYGISVGAYIHCTMIILLR